MYRNVLYVKNSFLTKVETICYGGELLSFYKVYFSLTAFGSLLMMR